MTNAASAAPNDVAGTDAATTGPAGTDTVTLVILGASGDLTSRLLLPGLGTLLDVDPDRRVRVVGAAVDDLDPPAWSARLSQALARGGCPSQTVARLAADTAYVQVDLTDDDALRRLTARLRSPAVLYFALPPAVTAQVCARLARIGLPDGVRLALEKPFGYDLDSARALNGVLHEIVDESRIFRVDHFLGKAAILNLLGFRFANRIFEPVWNAVNIEHVDIVFDESLALEGRARYYDNAGALIDMIQSHLLLVLGIVAMEDPARIDAREFRDLLAQVLRAVELWDDPVASSRRGRYTAGRVGQTAVPNYVDEPGVDPARDTETLAEVTVRINNARWAGVPFRLRSGKAIGQDTRSIIVTFRPIAHLPSGLSPQPAPNVLRIDMNPERLCLDIATNSAGDKFVLERTSLRAEIGASAIRPYGEILAHIMDGDPLLSVRADIAEECWRILTPVVAAWRDGTVPMQEYPAGSDGWVEPASTSTGSVNRSS